MKIGPVNLDVPSIEPNAVAAKLPAIAFAAFVGTFFFFAAGFADPAVVHNAAHDSRHVMAFPCH